MANTLTAEQRETLLDFIWQQARAGFRSQGDIARSAAETMMDEDGLEPEVLEAAARELTQDVFGSLRAEQQTWPAVTDCDRLDTAFAALEDRGVVARQDWTCCQNCGHSEIRDELKAALEKGRVPHGYTFFHQQDTETAVDGGGLYLAFGAVAPGEDARVAVATEVAEALKSAGLTVHWDGSGERRIFVELDWKKRAPTRARARS